MGLDQYIRVFYEDGTDNEYYYRKMNWLRNWMVNNTSLEEGDDCKEIELKIDDIKKLHENCKEVLKNHELAEEILPTVNGFFFGDTEYNEYYFEDVNYVSCDLESMLDRKNDVEYICYEDWW